MAVLHGKGHGAARSSVPDCQNVPGAGEVGAPSTQSLRRIRIGCLADIRDRLSGWATGWKDKHTAGSYGDQGTVFTEDHVVLRLLRQSNGYGGILFAEVP